MKKHVQLFCLIPMAALVLSGCASTALKEENASLKQTVAQDQQALRDYADKLQAASEMSAQDKAQAEAQMDALRSELNKALQEKQVLVKRLEDLTIIEMQYDVLFESGKVDLNRSGRDIVGQIAEAFKKYPDYHMRVEGHSDNMPIGEPLKQTYYSNWELSAARAATVVRYMIYGLNVPGENLSIAGYADFRPVADNTSKDGRAQNRRIRAVIFKQ